jgi:hypothetical protein
MGKVLDAAREIGDERNRARALSVLAKRMPEVIGEAIAATRVIQDKGHSNYILSLLVQRLPEATRKLFEVKFLYKKQDNITTKNAEITHLPWWATPREFISSMLSTVKSFWVRPNLISEVRPTAQAIQNEWEEQERARALSTLTENKNMSVIGALQVILDENHRKRALDALTGHPLKATEKALLEAQAIGDEEIRADVLSTLAQSLPEGEMGKVLDTAQTIQDGWHRRRVLRNLVQPLMKVGKQECYEWIDATFDQLSLRMRAQLFSDLSALLPVLLYLGVEGLDREILFAVLDVTTWWP